MSKSPFNVISAARLALYAGVATAIINVGHGAHASQEKAAANFLQADSNSDGALSASEFRTFIDLNAADNIGRAGTIKRRGAYQLAFSRLDSNRDGQVTPSEISRVSQ